MKWPKTNGIVYVFGHCDFKSGWSSLGSNLITNNVNAVSLPRTTLGNAILGLQNGGAMHPSAPPRGGIALHFEVLGWHCPVLYSED